MVFMFFPDTTPRVAQEQWRGTTATRDPHRSARWGRFPGRTRKTLRSDIPGRSSAGSFAWTLPAQANGGEVRDFTGRLKILAERRGCRRGAGRGGPHLVAAGSGG